MPVCEVTMGPGTWYGAVRKAVKAGLIEATGSPWQSYPIPDDIMFWYPSPPRRSLSIAISMQSSPTYPKHPGHSPNAPSKAHQAMYRGNDEDGRQRCRECLRTS
jgi:hypothetical protein